MSGKPFAQEAGGSGRRRFHLRRAGSWRKHSPDEYGETLTYIRIGIQAGPGSPWDAMPEDLASAVQMLHKRYGLPEQKIAVGGASLGANVALVYASAHAQVPALVLLSPGIDYAGIQSGPAYYAYRGRPVFIAASPNDTYAYSSVHQLAALNSSPSQVVVDGKNGHGVNMFDEEFTKKLLDWMKGGTKHGNWNCRSA